MTKIHKREMLRFVQNLSKEDLEKEVLALFEKYEQVQQHYTQELGSLEDRKLMLDEYKGRIYKEFFPTRGVALPKASVLRKIISEYKKIAIFQHEIAELMLYRLECALQYQSKYGYTGETFYNALEVAFRETLQLIYNQQLLSIFRDRLRYFVYGGSKATRFTWYLEQTCVDTFREITGEIPERL